MMGFITSIIKFNSDIMMRLIGLLYLINSGVTIEDYGALSGIIYFGATLQLGAIGLSKYLVNRNEYYTMQVVIDKIDQMSAEQIAEFDAMQ
jgi:hypothetical protein